MTIEESLKRDLYYKRVKKIVDTSNTKHVFTVGKREFIFAKENNKLIFKTAIRHSQRSYDYKYQKLLKDKAK